MVSEITKNSIIFFAWCAIATMHANNNEEFFLQGNRYAQDGSLQEALDAYEKIDHKQVATWYNMGLAAQQLDKQDAAYVYFLHAFHQAPAREFYRMHDAVIDQQKKLGIYHEPTTTQNILLALTYCSRVVSLLGWQLLVLLLVYLSVMLYFYRRNFFGILSSVLLGIGVVLLATSYYDHRHYGVVTSQSTAVYSGMNNQFAQIGQINLYDTVVVYDQRDTWIQVGHSGIVGWVQKESVALL